MSKVVKRVGAAVSKVVSSVGKEVKRFSKSKFGKVVLTAAAIYFGGAALMGAMGTGTTAMGGLQAAWSGLGTAVSGGGMGGMASAFTTGAAPGVAAANAAAAAGAAAGSVAPAAAGGAGLSTAPVAANYSLTAGMAPTVGGTGAGLSVAPGAAATLGVPAASPGMLGSIMASPYTAPALISAGSGMLSGVAQGKQMQDMQDRQDAEKDKERARYNTNVGTRLWGGGV